MTTAQTRRVVILGGGFAGVTVAQELEKRLKRDPSVEVTLVSRDNYLLFVPMLAEVATGGIEMAHILSPLRQLCPRTTIRTETVHSVDLVNRTVTTVHATTHQETVLPFDYLVVAMGTVIDLSNLSGLNQHGLPIKTIGDALQIRNQVVDMLERAACVTDPVERRQLLTFVVAGGGFSGVEVAAELNEFVRSVCSAYRALDPNEVRVVLLHSGERILPELSADLALYAQRKLAERGVDIQLGRRIAAATATAAILRDGERLDTRTLIVAIGNAPNPVVAALSVAKERGQIVVNEFCEVAEQPGVWALGDCARVPLPGDAGSAPPTAQFALRQGKTVAQNIVAALGRGDRQSFTFTGLGQMASLGRLAGVAQVKNWRISGILAWIMWRTFYLGRLPGIERKARVLLDWNLDLIFRRDIAQLNVDRTQRFATAHYEPGETIIREGDFADRFFVIVKGTVQVFRVIDGVEQELRRLGPGDSFGEVALINNQRRNATVRAIEAVDVLALEQTDFNLVLRHWTRLSETLVEQASQRR